MFIIFTVSLIEQYYLSNNVHYLHSVTYPTVFTVSLIQQFVCLFVVVVVFCFVFAKHIVVGRLIVQHTFNTITCSHSFILHSVYKKFKSIRILTELSCVHYLQSVTYPTVNYLHNDTYPTVLIIFTVSIIQQC